ncbi:MAG: glycoside hydrolase family 3 C-terminal domain-containing protein [Bacteroidales bacterium]|nr:glycoside hydrolase family 3 C-terminal domain-containing protein [Bacteroidales bacterium]
MKATPCNAFLISILCLTLSLGGIPVDAKCQSKAYKPTGTDGKALEQIGSGKIDWNGKKINIYHQGWTDFNKNGLMDVYEDPSAPLQDRIEDLLSQMTVEEKTCQMVTLYGFRRVLQDDLPTPEWKNKLWKDGIGAIDEHLNGFRHWGIEPDTSIPWLWPASRHAWALNKVQSFFVEQTRLGIPVDFTDEGIRGVEAYIATNFPTQLGIGNTWDRELVREIGEITGREGRLLGYTNVYAPILDVGRDQRWGRYEEVYGEDPFLVSELGVEMVLGMQKDYQVAATGKHFAIYSNNKGGREGMARVDPQIAPHEVENIHMTPWREVIGRAGMLGVMSSYNDYDGIPVQGSSYWLTERLRKDFGFKGYVVSDSDAVEYLHSKHMVSRDMKESVRQAVEAGLNVRCTFRTPDSYVLPLRQLIEEGSLPMEMIDDRVRDILRVKFLIGLFDRPYQLDYAAADREVNSEENNHVALRASRESLVLLKNDGMLPLEASKLKRLAVIGPNADETSFVHTHYGPLATEAVSVLEGLRKALDGKAEVVYEKGCELVDAAWPESELIPTEPDAEELAAIERAVSLARSSEAVILVLGGGQRTCGENKSRSSLDLPGRQELLLKEVLATGTPVAVVLIGGRPMSVNRAKRDANAILEAWYPGSHGGTAIAEALLGDYNPGGKLSVTFPKSVGQIPFNFPFKPNSQVDGGNKPGLSGNQSRVNGALWDFGFGLSYTTFEYTNLSLSSNVIAPDGEVTVGFDITNTGKRDGDEIVQLYIHDCLSSITVYEKQLRGFERIHLEPGQTKTVKMTLGPAELSLLDANMKRVVECGDFDILVGASSTDIRLQAKLRVSDGNDPLDEDFYPDDASTRRACFPASINVSEDVTVPLKEGKLINDLAVEWGKGTECEFEILFTNGGGQFLPLYKGRAIGEGCGKYEFEATEASEIRISITKGHAVVKDMDSYAIKK